MPRGAAVTPYHGKRGTTWRIKYADADGRQVMETLGREPEWNRKKAEAELRERLVRVERRAYRRPKPITFGEYATAWFAEGSVRRRWKSSTVMQYRSVERRLVEHFGHIPLGAVRPRHVAEYVAAMSGTSGASIVGRDIDLLHAIFKSAVKEELIDSNPASGAERPKLPRNTWRILEPVEVARVAKEFGEDEQARVVFLTLVLTGVRRSELQALRWADVDLVESVLRVRDSKSEDGIRSIALSRTLAEELWQHRRRSHFQGEDERVFCHPERGTVYRAETFVEALTSALAAAGVEGRVRAFHDLRHTAITNDAAAGANPTALMTKAGHSDMKTTRTYLHLAGVVFREEAERLEARLLGTAELSTPLSTRMGEPESTEHDPAPASMRLDGPADPSDEIQLF